MVAAWISVDTGVGPAIASGSHVCSGNWPLLADHGDEERDRRHQQKGVANLPVDDLGVALDDAERAGAEEQDRHADEQADVTGSGGEEGLQGGVGVLLLLPPVPDQHERAEAHELPAEDHLDRVHGATRVEHPAVNRLSAA